MDRKKDAMGLRGADFVVTRLLPASVLLGLMVLLAILVGCQCQGQISTPRGMPQEIRPAGQMVRLVQNAEYFRKSGRLELAVEELEKARLREPDNLEILDLLAQCYEELGHFDRAQEIYDQALSQAGHHQALENNRCYSLYLQGRLEEAEACFRKVLRRDSDNQTARNNLGLVLCRQGREAEALTLWQKTSNETEARQLLGEALVALGREVPPHLAAADATPADRQTAAAGKPAATSVPEPSGPQALRHADQVSPEPAQAQIAPSLSLPPASPNRNLTTAAAAVPEPMERPQQIAAPASVSTPGAPADPPVQKRPQPVPEPAAAVRPETQTPPQTEVAVKKAGQEPASAPAVTAAGEKSTVDSSPILTALDLWETGIELRNGNGIRHCARDFRNRLSREGFHVVGIGNHLDFGLDETVIAYRTDAASVAKVLAQKFFPAAKLEAEGQTSPRADIRVSLGRDLIDNQEPADPGREEVAAVESMPPPPSAPVTPTLTEKAAMAEIPLVSPVAATDSPVVFAAPAPPRKMRVELRNGNGVPGLAQKMGRLLRFEGFTVVNIGNHKDYDLKETIIAYRPEAAEAAEVLSQRFFLGANLEEKNTLPFWMDIRVLMGQDLDTGPGPLAQMTP